MRIIEDLFRPGPNGAPPDVVSNAADILAKTTDWDHAIEVLSRHLTEAQLKAAIDAARAIKARQQKVELEPLATTPSTPDGCTKKRDCPHNSGKSHCLCGHRFPL